MTTFGSGLLTSRVAFPFPTKYYTKMEYAEVVTFNTGATADTTTTELPIRLNSLYDPDNANAIKPVGFAALSGIYAKYRVNRVHVLLRAHYASAGMWFVVAYVPPSSTFSTNASTINSLIANPYVQVAPLSTETGSATSQAYLTYSKQWNVWDLLGYTKAQFDAQVANVSGSDTTSPAAGYIPYLLINAANQGGTTAQQLKIDIKLIFDVEWFERDVLTS